MAKQIIVQEGQRDPSFRVNAGIYRFNSDNVRERVYIVTRGYASLQEAVQCIEDLKNKDSRFEDYEWYELQWVNPIDGRAFDVALTPVPSVNDEDDEEDEEAETDAARQYGEDHENH